MEHEYFMALALREAKKAYSLGEVPIGAVITKGEEVISRAYNRREIDKSALAHAEILAIEEACQRLGGWRLSGCTMYVTLEPCLMCAGAVINSRLTRLVYAAEDPKAGAVTSLYNTLEDTRLNHQVEVVTGVLQKEASALLKEFFKKLRSTKEGSELKNS